MCGSVRGIAIFVSLAVVFPAGLETRGSASGTAFSEGAYVDVTGASTRSLPWGASRPIGEARSGGRDPWVVVVVVPVIVAALVNGNDIVDLIDTVDDQGATSFVRTVTMRASTSTPRSFSAFSIRSSSFMTSRCADRTLVSVELPNVPHADDLGRRY